MRKKLQTFKNEWKRYSHLKRFNSKVPTLQEFKSYSEYCARTNESVPVPALHTPHQEQHKTSQYWENLIGANPLTNSDRAQLVEECKNWLINRTEEEIYNKMVSVRSELARLVEMVQVQEFRYNFYKATLSLQTSHYLNMRKLDEVAHYNERSSAIRVAHQKLRE